MLNNNQIKLVQTAVRAAGLRSKVFEGQYRFLLSHYTQPSGRPVTSCKQLNNMQLDDLLGICEAHGFRHPGKPDDFYRTRIAKNYGIASFAQQSAVKKLAGDLGWNEFQVGGLIKRLTAGEVTSITALTPRHAYKVIEALKAILSRQDGKQYSNLKEIEQDYMEAATDGKSQIR